MFLPQKNTTFTLGFLPESLEVSIVMLGERERKKERERKRERGIKRNKEREREG